MLSTLKKIRGKTSTQEFKKCPINQTLRDSHKISNPMILSIDPKKFQRTRYRQILYNKEVLHLRIHSRPG